MHNGDCFSAGGLRPVRGPGRSSAGRRDRRRHRGEWLGEKLSTAAGGRTGETNRRHGGSRRSASAAWAGPGTGRRAGLLTGGGAGDGAKNGEEGCPGKEE